MKSFKKVILLLSLIVVCSFILYGCIDNNITYEYKDEISIYFLEPIDMGHLRYNDGSGYSHEMANVKYLLSGKLSIDQRNSFITLQEEIIEYLINKGYVQSNFYFTCYVLSDYINRVTTDNNTAYMGIQCTKSYEQILSTLMAATSEYSNYGLLFGLSNIIANDLKFTKSSNIDVKIKSIVESQKDLEFFDISYPCFTSAYASQANQNFSKQVSYSLAKYALNKLGVNGTMDLLKIQSLNEFETQFVTLKNNWLTFLGSSIILTPNEIPIGFAYTGEQVPLSFMSNVAIYHLSRGYKDFLSSSFKSILYINENVLITDYVNTMLVLRILEEDMAVRYNMLKRDIDYPQLTVNLVAEGAINNPYYNTGSTRVFINSVIALVHEYSHYITLYKANIPYSSVAEAVIDYFDFFYGITSEVSLLILEGYNDPDIYAEKPIYIDDLSINWYNAMKKYYIKNLSIDSCFVDSHLKAIAAGKYNLAMCSASDVASNSFGYYLGEYYGEAILIELAKNISNPMPVIGKSWQQLFTEWEIWIKATFGEYFE